jgi:hypothetical protein
MKRLTKVAAAVACSALLAGCDSLPKAASSIGQRLPSTNLLPTSLPIIPTSQPAPESDAGGTVAKTGGCALGAIAAGFGAKMLAAAEAKRKKLPPAAAAKLERSYMIGLALIGCGGGSALAGTAYAKLSDAGKQAREREMIEAASSAKVRTYADPGNPSLQGRVVPSAAYAEAGNRECRDVEDLLSDAGKGDPAVIKMCRTPPNGGWAPAVPV